MPLTSGENTSKSNIPQGVHDAMFVGVWDLGEQLMAGQFPGWKHRCLIMWEIKGGETVSKEYSWYPFLPAKSTLRKDLESWVCKGPFSDEKLKNIDYSRLLGQYCQVLIMNNEKGYPKVESVLPAKDTSFTAVSKRIFFEVGNQIPDGTPNWVIERIKKCKELSGAPADESQGGSPQPENQAYQGGGGDDTVPF